MASDTITETGERSGLELIDEAMMLVRSSLNGGMLYYLVGTLPFLAGFMFFFLEMTRSSFARENAAKLSLMMALLFLWMKTWDALYCSELHDRVKGGTEGELSAGRIRTVARRQVLVQSTGLVLLPVALIVAIPFGWVYAFFQHYTVYSGKDRTLDTSLFTRSKARAKQWSLQNHMVLFLISFFAIFVYVGVMVLCAFLPEMLRRLTGVQSFFTRSSPYQFLSFFSDPTFHMIALCCTYLLTDPVMMAVYVLRTFYGESIESGEDLKTELRRIQRRTGEAIRNSTMLWPFLLIFAGFVTAGPDAFAEPDRPRVGPEQHAQVDVQEEELERSIQREISSIKYDWRMPKKKEEPGQKLPENNWLVQFLDDVTDWIGDSIESLLEWLIGDPEPAPSGSYDPGGGIGPSTIKLLLILAGCILLAFGLYLLVSYVRENREMDETEGESAPEDGDDVDLDEEEVDPRSRPANHWEELAREMMDREEYRKAIRALFLASLSFLADNRLIDIRQYKSNMAYQHELDRRLHGEDQRVEAFRENVRTFEGIWYGQHEATASLLRRFRENQELITMGTPSNEP